MIRDGIELTDSQIATLDYKASNNNFYEEIETADPVYLSSQDAFNGAIQKSVGCIYQQTFINIYSIVANF